MKADLRNLVDLQEQGYFCLQALWSTGECMLSALQNIGARGKMNESADSLRPLSDL